MNLTYIFILCAFLAFLFKKNKSLDTWLGKENADATKALAALIIVVNHSLGFLNQEHMLPQVFSKLNFGWHWVAIFFFWTGYGLVNKISRDKSYQKNFIKTRFIKIFIPFFVVHIIYFVIKTAFGDSFNFKDILFGLLGQLNIVEYSWYPVAALIMCLLLWIVYNINVSSNWKLTIFSVSIIVLSFFEWAVFENKDWWYISNLSIVLGAIAAQYKDILYKKKWIVIIFSAIIYCGALILVPLGNIVFGEYLMPIYIISCNIQTAALSILFIISADIINIKNIKFLKFINKFSYEIYLMHGIVIYILGRTIFIKNSVCFIAAVLAATPAVSYAVNKLNVSILKKIS